MGKRKLEVRDDGEENVIVYLYIHISIYMIIHSHIYLERRIESYRNVRT